jgi:hypothetical protein
MAQGLVATRFTVNKPTLNKDAWEEPRTFNTLEEAKEYCKSTPTGGLISEHL